MSSYLRPGSVGAATDALAMAPNERPWIVVAGATDHFPGRVGRMLDEDILDVTAISELGGIQAVEGGWRIGALATWTDLVETPLPHLFDGLKAAARTVGGLQIQARGTVVGNVCNASPAADGTPNLLAMDAEVELASARGPRRVPVGAFVTGNRRTDRAADELVTGLFVPAPLADAEVRSGFEKLGSRAYLVISIAMVAAIVEVSDGLISRARISVGACSEVARRLPELEAALAGAAAGPAAAGIVTADHLAGLQPIDDVRGSAAYRREAALELVRRALARLLP